MDNDPTPLEQDENFEFFKAHEFDARIPCSASTSQGFREVHCAEPSMVLMKFHHMFGITGRRDCTPFLMTLCATHAEELKEVSVPGLIDGIVKNKGICPGCGRAVESLEDVLEITDIK